MSPPDWRKTKYDHPAGFDWPLMLQHVQALCQDQAIEMPECDFAAVNRSSMTIAVRPAPM
jgi:uridine kinase